MAYCCVNFLPLFLLNVHVKRTESKYIILHSHSFYQFNNRLVTES